MPKLFHEMLLLFAPALLGLSLEGESGGGGAAGGTSGDGAAGAGGGGAGGGTGSAAGTGDGAASSGGGAGAGEGDKGSGGTAVAGGAGQGILLGPDGNFVKGWSKMLEVDENLETKFGSPKSLAKSYVDLQRFVSAKGIIKPGPNATPAEMDAYYTQLGRPSKVEEYGIAKPDTITVDGKQVPVPPEVWDAASVKDASALFHKIGLTKDQAAALVQFDVLRGVNGKAKFDGLMDQGRTQAEAKLKTEWGAKYDENLRLANEGALAAGMTKEEMQSSPHISNDPSFIRAMAKVGRMIGESPTAGARGSQSSPVNPAAEIAAIYADQNHPWHSKNANKNPAGHKAAVERMQQLYKLKHGEA